MPKGLISISGVRDADGKTVSLQKAYEYGWINGQPGAKVRGWDVDRNEVVIGNNLFLDNGRQLLAYCFAFRSPIQDYTCSNFGVGTGITTARVTDTALEAPITLSSGSVIKPIDTINFLSAFVVRVSFTLGIADANGYGITEMGLFSGNGTIIARKVRAVVISKNADFSPTLCWRIRF